MDEIRVYQEARKQYLEDHPEPEIIDFYCYGCKAQPGEPCQIKKKGKQFHAQRQDKYIRAMNQRQADATTAGDERINKMRGRSYGR